MSTAEYRGLFEERNQALMTKSLERDIIQRPLTLILDTSGNTCSLVLARGNNLLWEQTHPMMRGHDRALLPLIAESVAQEGLPLTDVQKIICVVGPGSFTGLRIGIAAAQGLCLAIGATGSGVTAFDAMVGERSHAAPLLALIPTQTGQYYGQVFGPQAGEPGVMLQEDVQAFLRETPTCQVVLSQPDSLMDGAGVPYKVLPVNALGAYGAIKKSVTLRPLLPFYLRESTPMRKLQS